MGYEAKLNDMRNELRALYKAAPDATRGFGGLTRAVKDAGVLDHKQKELIAAGMALVQRCEPCITTHVEALVKLGATREELCDVIGLCIQMSGGPGLMYGAKALACFDELAVAAMAD